MKKDNLIMIISLMLWIVITLVRVMHHSPWYDEAHAWLIAQELNIFEIVKLMKIEGHTFIWYLLLMPFAKSNYMYPYSMLFLNWLFCFIAVLILWLKSPFNNFIKILISFSFPFLALYPVVARCYSIGIMFLFAITAMEKKKLNHPNWYALLLILCANTSIMAMVGATVFGILFIFELLKNKRNVLVPFLIMILGAIIVFFQLPFGLSENVLISTLMPRPISMWIFTSVFFKNYLFVNVLCLIVLMFSMLLFYFKNKIFPIFLILSYILLFSIFNFYYGRMWHHFFFYIYFIISTWLLYSKYQCKSIKWEFIPLLVLSFVSLLFIFFTPLNKEIKEIWNNTTSKLAKIILDDKSLLHSTIFVTSMKQSIFPIYFRGKNINVINYCAQNTDMWDVRSYYFSDVCLFVGEKSEGIVVLKDDYITRFYTDNSYLLTRTKFETSNGTFAEGLNKYKFVLYKDLGEIYLWKIEKINGK